jgi:hypothetical protein
MGRGGPRPRRLRDLLPNAASHVGRRTDLRRPPGFVPVLTLALNLPRGMRRDMPTAVQSTLARLRAPTCWPAWPRRTTFLLLHARIARMRETLLRATALLWEFEGVEPRLGPRPSGEEARPRLPAANLLASAEGPRAAEFEGGITRLGRMLTTVWSTTSETTSWLSDRRLGRLALLPLEPISLVATWVRVFPRPSANVN